MIGHKLAQAIEYPLSFAPLTRAVDSSTILAGAQIHRNFAESRMILMEEKYMKIAFVRFTTSYRGEVSSPRVLLVNGEAAENHENFRAWYIWVSGDDEIVILNWFEVPKDWENLVAGDGCMHDALEALIALDALADTPVVSDLLATIFEEGYRLAEKKERKLEAALNALLVS